MWGRQLTVAIVVVAKWRALMYFVKEGASLISCPSAKV